MQQHKPAAAVGDLATMHQHYSSHVLRCVTRQFADHLIELWTSKHHWWSGKGADSEADLDDPTECDCHSFTGYRIRPSYTIDPYDRCHSRLGRCFPGCSTHQR
jgi:hypothetical protein